MTNFQKLSETEMEVMKVIWASPHPVTSSELLDIFATRGKEWKGQTMSTFLTRLVDKKVLISTRQGRANIYEPSISPEEYQSQEANSILQTLYKGSVKNFLTTLYGGEKMTKDEIVELRQWFVEKAGERSE